MKVSCRAKDDGTIGRRSNIRTTIEQEDRGKCTRMIEGNGEFGSSKRRDFMRMLRRRVANERAIPKTLYIWIEQEMATILPSVSL